MDKKVQTIRANGDLVRSYRHSLGITQRKLSKLSGYSERLILKLEAGEPVRRSTLEIIAETFCDLGLELTMTDLSTSPLAVAKGFVNAYRTYEVDFMVHAAHLISPEIKIEVAGDPDVIPFSGKFYGHDGMEDFLRKFFAFLHRPEKDFFNPQYFVNGNEVAAFGQEIAGVVGSPSPAAAEPRWMALRFVVKDGRIVEFFDLYDAQSAARYIEKFSSQNVN